MALGWGGGVGVLIVDDEPDVRETYRVLLETYGHTGVRTAGSAGEALALLAAPSAANDVDLILTDVAMPGLSGIEMCRHVKATPALTHIPVLVMTGWVTEDVLDRAFAAGAHDFVPKGVSPPELLARVRAALNLKHELDRRRARERELEDVTRELERANLRLHRLAVQDELTGVPNRRYFNLLLHREWGRAARDHRPLGLILADVDHFKAFNDRYGHPDGDSCLARVAATLTRHVRRPADAVARYGGEEFAVLLPNTDAAGAGTVAEGLRAAVAGLGLEHAGSSFLRVTISLGVAAVVPTAGMSADRLVRAADAALYRAKAAGRNRVEVAVGNGTEAVPTG